MAAITFKTGDAYSVMNSLVRQATGQTNITAVDTSSFVSAGSAVLDTGVENVLNALSVLIGKTIIASRPYTGKFKSIIADKGDAFTARLRKISVYAQDNITTGMFNANDSYPNLGAGLNDGSGAGSQWEQFPTYVAERYFYSEFAWDKAHTQYPEQIKKAFTNPADFIDFVNTVLVEVQNDIESTIEAKNRMAVLDKMAGTYLFKDVRPECAVNITAEFNTEFGTSYTTAQLLQSHLTELLEYLATRIQIDSDRLTDRTASYHNPMTKTVDGVNYSILRHTPKNKQKFIYLKEFITKAKGMVYPEIFNPQYIPEVNGEGINFWQSSTDRGAINVKPSVPVGSDGNAEVTSAAVSLGNVIGLLFDTDALVTNNKYESMYQTPINARHVYTNTFWHYKFGLINDYSENAILYYMADDETQTFAGDGTTKNFTVTDKPALLTGVTVGGTAVTTGWTYTASTGKLAFTTAPADKAVIVAHYEK